MVSTRMSCTFRLAIARQAIDQEERQQQQHRSQTNIKIKTLKKVIELREHRQTLVR